MSKAREKRNAVDVEQKKKLYEGERKPPFDAPENDKIEKN